MSEAATAKRLLPVFIGVGLTVALLFGIGVVAERRRNAAPLAQPIHLVAPRDGQSVDSPLVIRFSTAEPLELHPTGWGTAKLHLHARVGGVEHMPAADELTGAGSVFSWTMPAVPRGTHTVQLGWADLHHRELTAGRTAPFTITVR